MSGNKFSTIATALITLVVIVAVFWIQYLTQVNRSPIAYGASELLGADEATDFPMTIIDQAKRRLSKTPNDQATLNLLLVGLSRTGASDAEKSKAASLLSKLGWRKNAAQQNLIAEAIKTENFETIVKSSDALLRRNQSEEQILSLLHLVEVEPEVQPILVKQLSYTPNWRSNFLTRTEYLQTDAQIAARARTLNLMLDDGQEIKRANLATSLNTMMGAGRYEDALQIFKKNTEAPTSNNINDTNFVLLAQSRDIPYYRPFPFDWTRHQKRGLQISAYESIGDAEVKLRWDGRGAPLMLSQYVNVEVGKNYNLVLTGLDATENIVKRLQFFLNCKSGIVRFDQGRKDIKTNQLILSSDSTPSCAFPRLEIRGRIQEVRRPNEISLSSLNLLASE